MTMTRTLALLAAVLALTAGFGASTSAFAAPAPATARLHTGATSPLGTDGDGLRHARSLVVIVPRATR